MTKLASKILGFFISDVTAGACVSNHGCCCGTRGHAVGCLGHCVKNPQCFTGPNCSIG